MQYLLTEKEYSDLLTQAEMDQREGKTQEVIRLLREKVLALSNTVCIHDPHYGNHLYPYCDKCPLSKAQRGWQEPHLCNLPQHYGK